MKSILSLFIFLLASAQGYGQNGQLTGRVVGADEPLGYASLQLESGSFHRGGSSDDDGSYSFTDLPAGTYTLRVSRLGYRARVEQIEILPGQKLALDVTLEEDRLNLNEVVVSATRYELGRQVNPVMVNVLSSRMLNASQAVSLSEGLNFQPGVRIETNCQNCGFTQVRLNGLEGAYSQILINSRAVFSALNSVYGLDQIPTNIIERVEVVRSGGSALYGSNAIAGTINIITREPEINSWQVSSNIALIDGTTPDNSVNFNASLVNDAMSSGVTFYGMYRNRDSYDANGDGFSEITQLRNNTFGAKAFFKPGERSKVTLDLNAIREYRRGGDRLDLSPHFTDITEVLDHNTLIGGINYDLQSRDGDQSFSVYASAQRTKRKSYYGGLGGGRTTADSIAAANAYGNTDDLAMVGGMQFTTILPSEDVIVAGIENQYSKVDDVISGYSRKVEQRVNSLGAYLQYEWKLGERVKALLGARYDNTSVLGQYGVGDISREVDLNTAVLSPRVTLMVKLAETLQLRGGYARGFRAPQAFNEDLHISSVGGEPQFVILGEELEKETSDALTASLNYTYAFEGAQYNFLVEGFYTMLQNPFAVVSTGSLLSNGSILEEVRNGSGAKVGGVNLEASFSPSRAFMFQAGGTVQNSRYRKEQVLFEPIEGEESVVSSREFVRSPQVYGYLALNWSPTSSLSFDLTGIYTGSMVVPRVVSPRGFMELVDSDPFMEVNLKGSYHFDLSEHFHLELSGGVQNIFNSYQDDFDVGAGRDSDYIYGPFRPRTFFVGVKVGDFH